MLKKLYRSLKAISVPVCRRTFRGFLPCPIDNVDFSPPFHTPFRSQLRPGISNLFFMLGQKWLLMSDVYIIALFPLCSSDRVFVNIKATVLVIFASGADGPLSENTVR
jgi:hypothetical protein